LLALKYAEQRIQRPASGIDFSNDEIARYSRHLIMPEVTLDGQKRIKAASILCIGAGGLGSPIALYLAAASADGLVLRHR
jgi:adenylyltransferase/sulfurtransferase